MEILNNKVIPSNNRLLQVNGKIYSTVTLGKSTSIVNNQLVDEVVNTEDVIEVTPVMIDDRVEYIQSTNYDDIVSELIRLRYSLNAELALYANSRLNPDSQEEKDFQEYRAYCKKLAKLILNE